MESITRKAYAKINLGLDVIRRRPDGYHEVKMIMQAVDLWDLLTFKKSSQPGIQMSCLNARLPVDKRNLVYRAAELISQEYGIEDGIEITLKKHIPIAAGMAGGSTDAAAVFWGMNELFELNMTMEQMQELGVKLGADIPYCIMGGTALSEGIGEKLSKLPSPPSCYLVIAKPDIYVSTKFVYENLKLDEKVVHPDIDGMVEAIRQGSLHGITDRMGNVLETVTIKEYPIIEEIKESMKADGAVNALMSGSGPTVFGVFMKESEAVKAADTIKRNGLAGQIYVTGFFTQKDN